MKATLSRALREPAVWILVVFFVLVVAEMAFWVANRGQIPRSVTGSIMYPVLLAVLAYVLVFRGTDHYRNFKALLTAFSFGVAGASLFLLSKKPALFDAMAVEDGFIEMLSAAALFVGAALFLILAIGHVRRQSIVAAVVAAVFALVLFIIGMEEISWMQRILNFETSDYFLERNIQNEMNLHNFNTGVTEKVFYFGGFLTLILMPYFHGALTGLLQRLKHPELAALLPQPWVLVPSSVMVGYVGTSVLRDPTASIAALVTVLILFHLTLQSLQSGNLPKFLIYGTFMALVCVMAYYFTTYNYSLVDIRSSARKEYLELIIALGLMAWAASALRQTVRLSGIESSEKLPAAR